MKDVTHRIWRVQVAVLGADSTEAFTAYDDYLESLLQYEALLALEKEAR